MTEQQIPSPVSGSPITPSRANGTSAPPRSGAWMGWVRFGGVVMTIIGGFAVVEGFFALFSPTYVTLTGEAVLLFDLTAWGWIHILLGVLVLATGLGLLSGAGASWARGVGIVLLALNTIVQLAFLPAYPLWSIILIILDIVVIYALMVTWGEESEY
ncbi:hypothetical protein EV188_105277 [Actinomycetospora succinea]|uniref:DUF7144 domain-containing protein n=1 Tax=Actinomycetospora succinea TaxID=663603 RepID=A0A4R6V9K3_9PSEU|nr:hypothetical protein [Actinomycetospora succinea]TDQ55879.1 hypothetical protein EV188_105277 [Actinomycetospora succinea]